MFSTSGHDQPSPAFRFAEGAFAMLPRFLLSAALAVGLATPALAQDKPALTVYTYASFTGK